MAPLFIFVAIAFFGLTEAAKFPKDWKRCKQDAKMNECLKDAIQKVVPILVRGVPSLGVIPIDPLHLEKLSIGRGKGHPVDLDLEFMDGDITGIKDVIIKKVEGDWKTMRINVTSPKLSFNSQYKVNGKVLVLPITGDGNCEIEFENFRAYITLTIGEKSAGSKKYYNIDDMDIVLDCDLMKLKLEGLFKGDKALGDQMNIFLNENWQELLKELGPPIGKALAMAYSSVGNRVFSKIPKDQITPP